MHQLRRDQWVFLTGLGVVGHRLLSNRAPMSRRAVRLELQAHGQLAVPLVPLEGIAELASESVRRDGGSRESRIILASDMTEYYAKSPALMPGHRFLGVNEFLVNRLARMMGIPTRPVELIRWEGEMYVGSSLIENDRKMTGPLTPDAWARLRNAPGVAYDVVVLDGWTMNSDRHCLNWLGGVLAGHAGFFLANDHDYALLPPGASANELPGLIGTPLAPHFFRCDVIRGAISDPAALAHSISQALRIDEASLRVIVGQLPEEWVTSGDRLAIIEFLNGRRGQLTELFDAADATLFPNLASDR